MKLIQYVITISLLSISWLLLSQEVPKGNNTYKSITEKQPTDKNLMHIYMDTRVDMQSIKKDGETVENSFRANTVRIRVMGEITPGIRYYLRHRLNRTQVANSRDNFAAATDHAYIQLDAGEKFTFSIGKQLTQYGTFEFNANSADIYMLTLAGTELDYYKTGINIAYKTNKQVFNLQFVNSPAPSIAAETYSKKSFGGAFQWEGHFVNNIIKTRWGYAIYQSNKEKFYHWITLGNQLNIHKFCAEIDWFYGRQNANYSNLVGDSNLGIREVQDQSLGIGLSYNLGKFKPRIKGIYDKRKDVVSDGIYENLGIQTALEYFPFKQNKKAKDLRFHLAYLYKNTFFSNLYENIKDINQNTFLAGFRWYFIIL